MTTKSKTTTKAEPKPAPRRFTIERTYQAPVADIWALWTTKDGIESWWGPGGFRVEVRKLDLWPEGELLYTMIAVAPEMVAYMKKAGMQTSHDVRIIYSEIEVERRLAYINVADFIPGVAPYDVATVVELHPSAAGVRMVLTFDAMHDEEWTQRQAMGWESEVGKLDRLIAARSTSSRGPA